MLGDIDVEAKYSDIEDCHRIGQPDKGNSKKTIIQFVNKKYFQKIVVK